MNALAFRAMADWSTCSSGNSQASSSPHASTARSSRCSRACLPSTSATSARVGAHTRISVSRTTSTMRVRSIRRGWRCRLASSSQTRADFWSRVERRRPRLQEASEQLAATLRQRLDAVGRKADLQDLAVSVGRRLSGASRLGAGPCDSRRRRMGLAAALVLFVGGFILGVLNLPEVETEPRWELLAVVAAPRRAGNPRSERGRVPGDGGDRRAIGSRSSLRCGSASSRPPRICCRFPAPCSSRRTRSGSSGGSYGKIARSTGAVALFFLATTGVMAGGVLLGAESLRSGDPDRRGIVLLGLALLCSRRVGPLGGRDSSSLPSPRRRSNRRQGRSPRPSSWSRSDTRRGQRRLSSHPRSSDRNRTGLLPCRARCGRGVCCGVEPARGLSAAVGFVATAVDRLISILGLAVITGAFCWWTAAGTPLAPLSAEERRLQPRTRNGGCAANWP